MRKTLKTLNTFMVAGGIAVALSLSAVTAASAGGPAAGTVTAVTHSSHHADTTSIAGDCTVASAGGPVWAYDNLSLRLSAVPTGTNHYSVTITAHGNFDAISNPITGACYTGHGSVDGWLKYEVSSATAPDPANLPAQVDGTLGQGAILNAFFDGNATIVGGGTYSYSYNQIDGSKYIQHS